MKKTVLVLLCTVLILVSCGKKVEETSIVDQNTDEISIEKGGIDEINGEIRDFSLEESSWVMDSIMDDNKMLQLEIFADSTLNFSSEGIVSGVAVCNNFTASYTVQEQQIDIGTLGVTKKACIGSEFSEYKITDALENIETYVVIDDKLILTSNDNNYKIIYNLKK